MNDTGVARSIPQKVPTHCVSFRRSVTKGVTVCGPLVELADRNGGHEVDEDVGWDDGSPFE